MQQRAGLLYLSLKSHKIFLILNGDSWSVPTFERKGSLLDDVLPLFSKYSEGKILPIELYISKDKGFEYGTYVCLVDNDFSVKDSVSYAWVSMTGLPKHLHNGLKSTLNNHITKIKLETILELSNEYNKK
jgi:hypothetical protein